MMWRVSSGDPPEVEFHLASALNPAKIALGQAAEKASVRRLRMYGDKVPCMAGCSGCCSRLVSLTVAECLILYESLTASGDWKEVSARAREQWRDASAVNRLAWFKMNRKCPVLDPGTNECLAYAVRPSFCSTHFVTSSPKSCEPWSPEGGNFQPLDFDDIHVEFRTKLMETVASFGILGYELPLPVGLMLAERISVQSGLDFQDVLRLTLQELGHAG